MSGGASDFMAVLQSVAVAGSRVTKGQVVAEFDRQYQQNRVDDYTAELQQAERTLRGLDANIEVARKSMSLALERARANVAKAELDIKTIPVRSAIQAETLRLALEEAKANLKQIEAGLAFQEASIKAQRRNSELEVDQQRAELKRAEANIEKMLVKAPMDGMLVMQNTIRGTDFGQIKQGDQLFPGQMFAQIVDPGSMLVSAAVNQSDVESLRIGAKASLRFDAFPDLELPAHVVSIAAITRTGGMRANFYKEVPVYLKIDRMDPRVIPDLSVSADVVIAESPSTTIVPLESVFQEAPAAKPFVYVRTAQGFERREVELGLRNNIHTGVVNGLKAGETVALEPPGAANGKAASASASPPAAKTGSNQES